tara:strand:+ start:4293 stop:5093 length:801 start_codon:yes stop_codon:yes gene_type:complete
MRFTKQQVLRIIHEEVKGLEGLEGVDSIEGVESVVDVETVEDAWAGGENVVEPMDHSEAGGGEKEPTTGLEVQEIVERVARKLRIKRLIKEIDWVDPMAFLPDAEATEQAWAAGDRLSLMIDQPGLVGEEEPTEEKEEEISERIFRKLRLKKLVREAEERIVFDPSDVDLPIPKPLQRLLDPNITPQKFATFDAELDASGKPLHQAFALAAFAMTYADMDGKAGADLMRKAIAMIPKIEKGMEKAKAEEGKGDKEVPAEGEEAKKE